MHHRVASQTYIESAIDGNCYLFHVTHRDDEATVEVGVEGQVRQSPGPRNQRNKATAYGNRVLSARAARLPGAAERRYTTASGDIPF
jgi:hypothetical protein